MASKWRQNVADLGLSNGEVELIARLNGVAFDAWIVKRFGDSSFWYEYRNLDPDHPPEVWAIGGLAGRPTGFPWGFDVEPDVDG